MKFFTFTTAAITILLLSLQFTESVEKGCLGNNGKCSNPECCCIWSSPTIGNVALSVCVPEGCVPGCDYRPKFCGGAAGYACPQGTICLLGVFICIPDSCDAVACEE